MTWKQAALRVMFASRVDWQRLTGQPWWDQECTDVALSLDALRALGMRVDQLNLAKALTALDYSNDEAAELACEAMPIGMRASDVEHYQAQLYGLANG